MTARTQKTTKVTDEDRAASLGDIKAQIRRTDPNLSEKEIQRRANIAAGLPVGDDIDLDEVPEGGRPRAAVRAVGSGARSAGNAARPIVTSSGARKTIFGVLALGLVLGILRDVRSGAAIRTDVIPRRMVGTFLSAVLLMALAGPAPRVARGLAFLVGFTIVTLNQETIATIAGSTDESVDKAGGTGPPEIVPGQPS